MPAEEAPRRVVAPHLCAPGATDPRTGEALCVVCGTLMDVAYHHGPDPRASVAEMLDELRARRTGFTATFRFRTGSLPSGEVPIFVDVGRELRLRRTRREAGAMPES